MPPDSRQPLRTIEVRVEELKQLFNSMDPSPFNRRDLDPAAEQFIVEASRELPRGVPLELLVHLDRCPGPAGEAEMLEDAVRTYFHGRRLATERKLKVLFRVGRVSLVIGLAFLTAALMLSQIVAESLASRPYGLLVSEGLLIGGWVAMWRPIEIFLYDWWPPRADARLFERLAAMPVRIQHTNAGAPDAWREDWPQSPAALSSTLRRGYSALAYGVGGAPIAMPRSCVTSPGKSALPAG